MDESHLAAFVHLYRLFKYIDPHSLSFIACSSAKYRRRSRPFQRHFDVWRAFRPDARRIDQRKTQRLARIPRQIERACAALSNEVSQLHLRSRSGQITDEHEQAQLRAKTLHRGRSTREADD